MHDNEKFNKEKMVLNMKSYMEKLNQLESSFIALKKEKEALEKEYYAIPNIIRNIFKNKEI